MTFAWPPDYLAVRRRRLEYLQLLNEDVEARYVAQRFYKNHPVEWINDWCVTFDPRKSGSVEDPRLMPFKLFPRQVDLVNFLWGCLQDKESGLIEKVRDAGASWVCSAFSAWLWLYHPGSIVGWGSRKEEYVDDSSDPKAIFPKIRQILEWLPMWMMPLGFNRRTDMTYMKIFNRENGSNITGEAGDNIGRGGRTTIYFKDESAHYERPEKIEAALGDNTNVQIDISSVNGSANVFYRRRMAGEIWEPGKVMPKGAVRIFIFDWREHPAKTQEWYDERRAKAEREGLLHIFAQEVDRDYLASIEGIIIRPEWIAACVDAHVRLADWGNWEAGEHTAANDIADGGRDTNAYASRHGVVLRRVEEWGGEAGDAARHGVPLAIEDNVHEYYYDSIGVGSGFKTESNTMKREGLIPPSMRILPWSAAAKVLDPTDNIIPGDSESPTNENQYENLKAQAWFRTRARAWKTYLAITRGQRFPVEEMMSIPSGLPNRHKLCTELSQAVKKTAKSGKTLVDKKPDDTKSPNLAESVVMCFNPTREVSGFDVL